jgi:chromosome segregation ATPase
MAFAFFNITKANAEIDRLNAELAKVTKERDDLKASAGTNGEEIAKQAEAIQAELATANTTIATLKEDAKALKADNDKKAGEIANLNKRVEGVAEEIKIKVAQQVANETAKIGAPAAPAIPAAAKEEKPGTGMSRILAAARADLQAAGYEKKPA